MVIVGDGEPNFFFKIILSPILQNKSLRIPGKFVREVRNDLSSTATLMVPAGKGWTVSLCSKGGEFWFCDGLEEFFESYSISFGYLLLFHYRGNSEFGVRIFDLTGCEIPYPSNDTSQQLSLSNQADRSPSLSEEEFHSDDDEVDANYTCDDDSDADCTSEEGDLDANCTSQYDNDDDANSASDDDLMVLDMPNLASKGKNPVELSSDDEALEKLFASNFLTHAEEDEFCSSGKNAKKRNLRSEGPSGAPVSSFPKSNNVSFRVVMRSYNIDEEPMSLNIPTRIGRKFPRGVSGSVKLEVSDGRAWIVQGNFLGGRLRSLGEGWADFARDTKLKVEDICQFEVITYDKQFSLKVSISRKKSTTR